MDSAKNHPTNLIPTFSGLISENIDTSNIIEQLA